MSGSANEYEELARDCVRLAGQADTPALREKLLNLAREWMQALFDEEDAERARRNVGRSKPSRGQPRRAK
jgi:hypothetical protein